MPTTLTERLKIEFGDLMDEKTITTHILPVVTEWLISKRSRPVEKDYGRRVSQDVRIDDLVKELKIESGKVS